MKKIMFICSSQVSVPPKQGGAIEDIVFEIAKHISKDMEPAVISRTKFSYPGIKCIRIKSKIRKNKIMAIIEDIKYGFRCINAIKNEEPDIVHLNTTFTSIPIVFFRDKEKIKILYTSHSPAWTVPDNEIGTANIIFNKIEAFSMKRADVITAVSESMRRGIIRKTRIPKNKVITIPNFSKPSEFSPKHGKNWKRKKGIGGRIVLFVGKLTETKGVPYLIGCISDVVTKFPDTMFVFVGSLEHEQKLSKNPWKDMVKGLNVGKNILFLGPVSKEELQKIYASADLFVLPTLREGMPLVILEAASSGLPIITTKVSGIPEIVDDKSAIFVKRKDSKSLAKSIIKIIADQKKAKKMGKEARKKVLRLRKEIILKKYKNLYTNLG